MTTNSRLAFLGRRLALVGSLVVVLLGASLGGGPLAGLTSAGSYYNCNSGDTLHGTTCTHTSTYPAASQTTHSCDSGGSLSGTTCTRTYSACTSWSGATYESGGQFAGYCMLKSDAKPTNGRCPSGVYYMNGACYSKHSATCNNGDKLNGGTCTHTYTATAHTTYSCSSGDSLNGTTCTHTSTYNAIYHSTSSGSSGSSGHSGSGGGSSLPAVVTTQPPTTPTNLTAQLQSGKVVQLTWDAVTTSSNISYELDRSTDNNNWSILTTTGDTSYNDSATDFNTTYYYRLKAMDDNGNNSDYATTQITTGNFNASANKLTSDDKAVTVVIPSGTFDQQVDCSFDSNAAANAPNLPADKLLLAGPYGLLCVGADGSTILTFSKPLQVTMKAPTGAYTNFDVRQTSGDNWGVIKSQYNPHKKTLSFNLTAATFAAFGTKQKSSAGLVWTILLLLLLLVAGFFAVRWFLARRAANQYALATAAPTAADEAATLPVPTAEEQFEEAALRPNCTHLNMAHQVQPQTSGCAECMAEHKHWKALRICLTCGHVGCSDDSAEQHARKHYEQTGHPLIYEYGNPKGDTIGWCYIDQTYI